MAIEVALFDFGGVIAEEGFRGGLSEIARANGSDEKTFVAAAFDAVYESGYVLGKAPESAFWTNLRLKTGLKGEDALMTREIFSRFTLRGWMLDLVDQIRARGIRVGILSDQTDMLDRLDGKYGFFKRFDVIFNSYHMGKGKRDPDLFDDIARTLRTKPDRILFIDDDPGHVERAKQKGWKAILYIDRESFFRDIEAVLSFES